MTPSLKSDDEARKSSSKTRAEPRNHSPVIVWGDSDAMPILLDTQGSCGAIVYLSATGGSSGALAILLATGGGSGALTIV